MSVGTGIFCSHCVRAATVVRSDVSFRTRWFVRESIHSFTFFIRRGCRTNIEQACREAPARALGVNLTFTSLEGQRYSFFISFVRYKIPKILDLMTIPFLIEPFEARSFNFSNFLNPFISDYSSVQDRASKTTFDGASTGSLSADGNDQLPRSIPPERALQSICQSGGSLAPVLVRDLIQTKRPPSVPFEPRRPCFRSLVTSRHFIGHTSVGGR